MVGPFPVFKLGTLALKQISKPIVNFLKQKAKSNEYFRRFACLPPAQLYHLWDTRLKLRLLGLSKPKEVPKLSEDAAADLGAEMLGEFLMFLFGAGILFYEYRRQARKESSKEDNLQKNFDDLNNQLNELSVLLEIHEARLREHTRLLATVTDDHCS
ncbi:uncharacterized protein DEA37_0008838 [Paragonimus westermani]|uniref:Optic atrophy 3 protein n=1 Tax=Paragonimus westermani TaxID=34504 RepID=A0A5J4NLB5_9TREM|nr:uncharacterized protein DEA37_0008838 [Paragonimus westermani]